MVSGVVIYSLYGGAINGGETCPKDSNIHSIRINKDAESLGVANTSASTICQSHPGTPKCRAIITNKKFAYQGAKDKESLGNANHCNEIRTDLVAACCYRDEYTNKSHSSNQEEPNSMDPKRREEFERVKEKQRRKHQNNPTNRESGSQQGR